MSEETQLALYICPSQIGVRFLQPTEIWMPNGLQTKPIIRPVQIFRHTLSPETCLKSGGQVRRFNDKSPFYPLNPKNWSFNGTFLLLKLLFYQASNNYPDKRIRFVIKCRYRSIGHTLLWVQWKLRYGQASPRDLLRPKGASPGLKFVSPGRRTCKMDRPE